MRFSDEAVLRLLVAIVLGALVGAEREATDQPAGLRTHIAVCLGACLFGIVSTLGFEEFEAERATTNVQIDVTRVASQVVVGIGFLGAGMIFRHRANVRNLTTAASLWVTAAIGLTAGVGDLATAAAAAGLLFLVLVALLPVRKVLRERVRRPVRELTIRLGPGGRASDVLAALEGFDVAIDRVHVGKQQADPTLELRLRGRPSQDLELVVAELVARPDVTDLGSLTDVDD